MYPQQQFNRFKLDSFLNNNIDTQKILSECMYNQ